MKINRLEYNKVIADFIADKPTRSMINGMYVLEYDLYNCPVLSDLFEDVNSLDPSAKHFFTTMEMRFHVSWDWLIPVVREILQVAEKNWDELGDSTQYSDLMNSLIGMDIDTVYRCTVDLIKLHNEKQDIEKYFKVKSEYGTLWVDDLGEIHKASIRDKSCYLNNIKRIDITAYDDMLDYFNIPNSVREARIEMFGYWTCDDKYEKPPLSYIVDMFKLKHFTIPSIGLAYDIERRRLIPINAPDGRLIFSDAFDIDQLDQQLFIEGLTEQDLGRILSWVPTH